MLLIRIRISPAPLECRLHRSTVCCAQDLSGGSQFTMQEDRVNSSSRRLRIPAGEKVDRSGQIPTQDGPAVTGYFRERSANWQLPFPFPPQHQASLPETPRQPCAGGGIVDAKSRHYIAIQSALGRFQTDVRFIHMKALQSLVETEAGGPSYDQDNLIKRADLHTSKERSPTHHLQSSAVNVSCEFA